ncbi:sensor histidine kinase [Arthrobacter sp. RIT-PI-e]|uniref:sensor histidine kinase n=1 Tax=Arthrobacter sp. RIT-PI-e TaxID=1681197 RepID=UPI000AE28705|nr:HAMP domain-containing sensor histidine kinase [Arthrobacter sp. RIT-PI-e]
MVQQEAAPGSGGDVAVVASPSDGDCRALAAVLTSGGLAADAVTSVELLLERILRVRPHVLLVDLDMALEYAGSLTGIVSEHPWLRALPVILLLPADGTVPARLEPYVSDILFRPVRPTELLQRTRTLISRRRERQEHRESTARLREHMRRISARVRSTNDPDVMVDQFLPDLGAALGADHLALQVFEDDRVAARSSSWTKEAASRGATPGAPLDQDAALALALTLWKQSSTADFGGDSPGTATARTPVPEGLRTGAGEDWGVGGVVAALGEGDTPFGLLWIVGDAGDLGWSGAMNGLTQHVLGNLAHGLIQAQLISRQHEAVRRLRALNVAKSDFVGTVNHQLRTPLASITGYIEMINDGLGGELPPAASTMLQAVERNTARLSELIENISALSSEEPDPSDHGPVDLVHLISEVTGRAVLEASAGGIGLDRELPDHAVTVSGHRAQLATALGVVLSNAIKFTQERGRVFVGLHLGPGDGRAVVEVRDTGIGIPAEDLPHLFDSFHRASNADRALPGAGVGLSVAKRTIEAHHGSITIDSTLGTGTSVAIALPLLDHAHVG